MLFLLLLLAHNLSMSSLGCKALSILWCFPFIWSICWSFSLVPFKNGSEYFTCETAKVFILLMKFLLCSLVSSSFLVLLMYLLLFSFHLGMFNGVHFQYSQAFLGFLFPEPSARRKVLVVLFLLSITVFYFSLLAFLIPSLYPDFI